VLRGRPNVEGVRRGPIRRRRSLVATPQARSIVVLTTVLTLAVAPQGSSAAPARSDASHPRVSLFAAQVTSSWATVTWSSPDGAAAFAVYRDGRLLDAFPAAGGASYTDHLLWPHTTYRYELEARDGSGGVLADAVTTITTPRRSGSIDRFYADSSFWNAPIARGAAVDPGSREMIAASIVPWRDHTVIDDDDAWGIPLAYADPNSTTYRIGCTRYGCGTDVSFPIPRYAAPSTGSDGHLAVYDPATNRELDMWQASYDPANDTWTAGSRSVTPAEWGAVCPPGQHCAGGGVAAGFNGWGGVIRPEEIAQGHIDHALVISMPHVRANFISCPATDIWASRSQGYAQDPNALPLGAHVRLSPNVDVAARAWPRWEKIVARALQTYGAYVADLDANITLRGEPPLDRGYDPWPKVGMTSVPHPSLRDLPWRRLQVLALQPC
jgi:hypothetical protein